jgi:hypothetical protein
MRNHVQGHPRTSRKSVPARLAAAVALAASAVAVTPTAEAAVDLYRVTYIETGVSSNNYFTSPDGCINSSTTIVAGTNSDTGRPELFFNFGWGDSCTYPFPRVDLYGHAEASTFDETANHSQVHVVAVVPLVDGLTGESAGTAMVDNLWQAVSRPAKSSVKQTVNLPGQYRITFRGTATAASAVVTGTHPSTNAQISTQSRLTFNLYHG